MILGIDIGTTSVKAVLLSPDGQVLAEAVHPHTLFSPFPGFAEENPDDWWQGFLNVVALVLDKCNRKDIKAIGISGMVPALVLHDDRGKPLRRSIQQNDARAVQEIHEFRKLFGDEWLFERTGATWNQQVVAPKLLWIKRHEPHNFARIHWISGSYEHIAQRLTGVRYQEVNWALESGLWLPREEIWLENVLNFVGLDSRVFGPVRRPWEVIGEVTREAATATGLPEGLPVIAGSADHIAAALASGLKESGEAAVKLGAAGDFLYVVDDFSPVPELFIDFHDVPGLFVINGCMATSGSLLRWFRDSFKPGVAFSALDQAAKRVPPGADGLVVLPYFLGEKTPIHDPNARGTIVGLTLSHTPEHLWRAILESIAFAFRHHFEILEYKGFAIKDVFILDGGARSALWRRIIASVLKRPVKYLVGGELGSAYGTAFLTGVAIGLWQYDDLQREIADTTEPDSDWIVVYDSLYEIYLELYTKLRTIFPRLGGSHA